tara:strand:- start:1155 stop:1274 length:120 start_codon:yes stop_codon:yes gene_type:complete
VDFVKKKIPHGQQAGGKNSFSTVKNTVVDTFAKQVKKWF